MRPEPTPHSPSLSSLPLTTSPSTNPPPPSSPPPPSPPSPPPIPPGVSAVSDGGPVALTGEAFDSPPLPPSPARHGTPLALVSQTGQSPTLLPMSEQGAPFRRGQERLDWSDMNIRSSGFPGSVAGETPGDRGDCRPSGPMELLMTSLPGTLLVVDDDEANRDMLSNGWSGRVRGHGRGGRQPGDRAGAGAAVRPRVARRPDAGPQRAGGPAGVRLAYPATELPVIMATALAESGTSSRRCTGRQRLCLQAAGFPRRAGQVERNCR